MLPVVYVIENNEYGMFSRTSEVMNVDIKSRAVAYGIPGVSVDGNDVLAVYEATNEAVARARGGGGPTLVECRTSRWHGHTEGDAQPYRTKEDIAMWMKKDPIIRFEEYLVQTGVLVKEETGAVRQKILVEMDEAVKFAENSPFPTSEETLEDVFA